MKKIIFLLVTFCYLYSNYSHAAQWTLLGPLSWTYEITILTIACKDSTVFVGCDNGIEVSTNNGSNWTRTFFLYTNHLVVDGSIIYALCGSSGLYKSTDNGQSWISTALTGVWVSSLYINGSTMFVGSIQGSVYVILRSTDNGLNWEVVGGTSIDITTALIGINSFVLSGKFYNGVKYSTNNGQSWIQSSLVNMFVHDFAVLGSKVFAAADSPGIYVSTDNGVNWSPAPINTGYVYSLNVHGPDIYAGNRSGIYRSSDNGLNWTLVYTAHSLSFVRALASNSTYIFAGESWTLSTLLKSSDNGQNWVHMAPSPTVYSLAASGTTVAAGTRGNGVYFSSDNGTNWVQSSLNDIKVNSLVYSGSVLFGGTDLNGIYKSTNNGQNWAQTSLNNQSVLSLAANGSNIFAGTISNGVYLSTNDGQNWTQSLLNNQTVNTVFINGTAIFAGTNINGIYVSTNNGQNWSQTSLNNQTVYTITGTGSALYAGTNTNGIYKSTDNGQSWVQTSLNNRNIYSLITDGSLIIAGTNDGVYTSNNNGLTWGLYNWGLQSFFIYSFAINGNNVYAGSELSGVFGSTLAQLVGLQSLHGSIPEQFNLLQNYPNPFNPSTKISFGIPANINSEISNVKLTIFDVLGREVTTLVDQQLKPGTYEVDWDASVHPSGVYFYMLQTEQFTQTKKMVLVK